MGEARLQLPDLHGGTTVPGRFSLSGVAAVTATREPPVLVESGSFVTNTSWSCISGIENLLLGHRARGTKDGASAELVKQLEALSSLMLGWDSYDAPAPNRRSIASARDFLESLSSRELGPAPVRVCASVEGGVGIVFQRDSRYADVEFLNDGSIVGGASDGSGRVDVDEWRDADTKEMLDWISEHL